MALAEFFNRPTLQVARDLLGQKLIRWHKHQPIKIGLIVETEAYLGSQDKASHAYRGKTKRNAPMFGPPGTIYVYLIYGMYYCLNLTTGPAGHPSAVLIRALEPLEDNQLELTRLTLRQKQRLTSGPGRLSRWLNIDTRLNHLNITDNPHLTIQLTSPVADDQVATGPRIGVAYAQEDALKPWRFYLKNHPFVSKSR